MTKKPSSPADLRNSGITVGRKRPNPQDEQELSEGEEDLQPIGIFYQHDDPEAGFWFHWNT